MYAHARNRCSVEHDVPMIILCHAVNERAFNAVDAVNLVRFACDALNIELVRDKKALRTPTCWQHLPQDSFAV